MKINYVLIIFCIIWGILNGYNNISEKKDISYENVSENAIDGYINIINQYTKVLTDDNYIDLIHNTELIGESLNTHLLMDFYNYNEYKEFGIYYALGDIDKNGIPELFIGGSYISEVPSLYDIFIFDKKKIIKPFTEIYYDSYGEFGNRTNIYFLQNGIIDVEWTNSGSNNGMEFYKVSTDGYSMELIESISIDGRMTLTGDGKTTTKYFHDKKGTIEISEDEFYSILRGYWAEGPETLSWIEIKP